ncbi:MAG: RNA polymerase subunit sigma, partial [Candidatus Heimdallarchaeota archaeon]|nr:RNA polymerase subunit sigma [Candidatus Heimdallarchaeota archaeon]
MRTTIDDELLETLESGEEEYSALGKLVELGRKQGYVTYDDILHRFPDAEQDIEQLEEVFAALLNTQIPYKEDEDDENEPEFIEKSESPEEIEIIEPEENRLANIDTKDLLGLYFKDAAHVPLLTGNEELNLAKQIETGRMARETLTESKILASQRE